MFFVLKENNLKNLFQKTLKHMFSKDSEDFKDIKEQAKALGRLFRSKVSIEAREL